MNDEILTLPELEAKYKGEWVLANVEEVDEQGFMIAGRVIAHGPDRDAVYSAGFKIPAPRHLATFCFKDPAEGTAIVL